MTRHNRPLITIPLIAAGLCWLGATGAAQDAAVLPPEGFQALFNGKDLSGWAGKTEFWSVKAGAIFGQTT